MKPVPCRRCNGSGYVTPDALAKAFQAIPANGATAGEIGKALGGRVRGTAVVQRLRRLEKLGLIRRAKVPGARGFRWRRAQ